MDTGSFFSILAHSAARKLNIKIIALNESNTRRLFSANGSQLKVLGTADIALSICSLILPVSVYIVENLNEQLILGREFLKSSSAILDFKSNTVTFSDTLSIPLFTPAKNVCYVRAIEPIFVSPETEVIIKVSCPKQFNNKDVLISHVQNKQFAAFGVANSCSKAFQNETHCRIVNFKNSNLVIPKGKIIGQVEAMDSSCRSISVSNDCNTDIHSLPPIEPHILEEFAKDYAFNINPDLPPDIRIKVLTLFYYKKDAFARSLEDLKQFNRREFEFELNTDKPIATRQYKLSEDHAKILDYHLTQWEKQGVLEESFDYRYNNAVFIVPKASLHSAEPNDRLNPRHWRAVADLRKLNSHIRKQVIYSASPKDILSEVTQYRILEPGTKPVRSLWMSTVDLTQGFMQIGLKGKCRDYVSITSTSGRHLKFTKAAYGLSVSPYFFSQAIQEIFHEMKMQGSLQFYVDDLLCHSVTINDHIKHLSQMLQVLIDADLKCSVSKSFFCYNKIRYLGVEISDKGLSIPDSVTRTLKKLKEMKLKNKKDVQKLLGYVIFWKNFIKNLSARTYHLRQLTHDNTKFVFSPECQAEREDIINELQNAPTLQAVDPYSPLFLVIDSSYKGIGITAMQHVKTRPTEAEIINEIKNTQAGRTKLIPILHLSYTISKSIQGYASTQLELYGLQRAVQTLSYLLKTRVIHCFSDNIGCTALLNLKLGNARQRRMIAYLQNYDITMHYTKGKIICADYLSRLDEYLDDGERVQWLPPSEEDIENSLFTIKDNVEVPMLSASHIHPLINVQPSQPKSLKTHCLNALAEPFTPSEALLNQVASITRKRIRRNARKPSPPHLISSHSYPPTPPTAQETPTIESYSSTELAQAEPETQESFEVDKYVFSAEDYENDEYLKPIYRFLKHDNLSGDKSTDYRTLLLADQFVIRNERMYHVSAPRSKKRIHADGPTHIVLEIPKRYQHAVLIQGHTQLGHFAGEKLFNFLRLYVHFKGMFEACHQTAQCCVVCQRSNINRNKQVAPLQNTPRHHPGHAWYYDHRVLSKKLASGVCALLVMTESYSSYTLIEPVTDLTVETTVRALFKRIYPFAPAWTTSISDRHQTFMSKGLAYFNKLTGIKHHHSASLSPQGHALIERSNLELNKLISKYANTDEEVCDLIPLFEYILHVNVNQSHGYSPHEILFGEKPPFNLNQEALESTDPVPQIPQYVSWLKNKLKLIRSDVDKNVLEARLGQKRTYDKKFKTAQPSFKQGDLCWLERLRCAPNSKSMTCHKRWDGPYFITQIVSRPQTFTPSASNAYPDIENCAMGVAYQLTDSRSGRIMKSLVNSRRMKPYVAADQFEAKFPPLFPRKPQIQPLTQAAGAETIAPASDQQASSIPIIAPSQQNDWFVARNIVRQRRRENQLEFLVRFHDNTSQWVKDADASEELKRRYFLRKAAARRRQQKNSRNAFKDD